MFKNVLHSVQRYAIFGESRLYPIFKLFFKRQMELNHLYNKALNMIPLTKKEAMILYSEAPTQELMKLAQEIRYQIIPQRRVSWQIDRNVNITNVCTSGCLFCNFHCKKQEHGKAFVTSLDQYKQKIDDMRALGGDQLLLQGGLHPDWGIAFYTELLGALKAYAPDVRLHALGPPEIAHVARKSNMSFRSVLERLVAAGLDSLPGAGAEILSDRVRRVISPGKPDSQAWLEVMREAHRMGLITSATMVFGHIETVEERIDHLFALRDLQAEKEPGTVGFLSFICWPMQLKGTRLAAQFVISPVSPVEYVRMVAMSRIVLYNVPNIQASWLTVGIPTAQLCLHAGANDMGSIMIEENVVSSAGSRHRLGAQEMEETIRTAGFEPWLRDQEYRSRNPYPLANRVV